MISASEFRLGNFVLQKQLNRVLMVRVNFDHFQMFAKGELVSFFPVALKEELLLKSGFIENKEYALYPQAHEFKLSLPVKGNNSNELVAYIKSNKECFCVAVVNGLIVSNPLYQLHQLQNLYHGLTGEELPLNVNK